jgi:sulfur carrier protein ThiS
LRVIIEENGEAIEREFSDGLDVCGILGTLGRYPDAHIVLIEGNPVPLTDAPDEGDTLRIIRVASGG